MARGMKVGLLSALIGAVLAPATSWALEGGHELELVARTMYWNDTSLKNQVTTKPVDFDQSALGVQLNYKSPYWNDLIGFDASLYSVVKLSDSGTPTTSILEVDNNGQLKNSTSSLAQAAVKFKFNDFAQLKIGRQLANGLLLKSSTSRAVPDTFSGVSGSMSPVKGMSIYGAVYDKWRARSSDVFESFKTESTKAGVPNAIDYISIAGVNYTSGPFSVNAEYLNSKDYLTKYGLVGAYKIPLDKDSLKLSGGIFTSSSAGGLFVCGAEKEVDCSSIGSSLSKSNATGIYLDADWKVSNFTLGAGVSTFDGLWIEDNFAANGAKTGTLNQDHGTNPFPTSSALGPDFANNGETAWVVRFGYDWKDYVKGLNTTFKYTKGTGAKSSNLSNIAVGNESYKELSVKYDLPFTKNLVLSYTYGKYDSNVDNYTSGTIGGLTRSSWENNRIYLDYLYKF